MKAKKALIGIGMLAMVFGVASGVQAITLEQYMNAPDKVEQASKGSPSKGDIVAHVYKQYAAHYSKKDPAIAECMTNVYLAKTPEGGSRLNALVSYNLEQAAKRPDARKFSVESVIQSVIKAECGASGTAKTEPVRPGGPG